MKKISIILSLLLITSCSLTGNVVKQIIPEETNKAQDIYFCPRDDCERRFLEIAENADTIKCAFYDLDLKNMIDLLNSKNAFVIIDDSNEEDLNIKNLKPDNRKALMHNKFCIFDKNTVWTGSFNPTVRGNTTNNNNVVVIYSKYLAENYEQEFDNMWDGDFGRDERVKYPLIVLNNKKIENHFCPEDDCKQHVIENLQSAEKSIYFMTFSFTDDEIGDLLVAKHEQGIEVKGVFEKTQNNQWNEFEKLQKSGIDIKWDSNKANMHHKVFIIDEKTVITGSYNPTNNGNNKNDENIVVFHDETIAEKFMQEFDNVWK